MTWIVGRYIFSRNGFLREPNPYLLKFWQSPLIIPNDLADEHDLISNVTFPTFFFFLEQNLLDADFSKMNLNYGFSQLFMMERRGNNIYSATIGKPNQYNGIKKKKEKKKSSSIVYFASTEVHC